MGPEATLQPTSADGAEKVERPTIVMHDFGDVTLLIGPEENEQPVLASIATLRLASPVWKAMFGTRWAECEASEIPLPDDDVDAMILVLRIAHLRFHELPGERRLSSKALLNLSIVCDKYDLVRLVRPFLDLYVYLGYRMYRIPKTTQCLVQDTRQWGY
jgi:hypothetical protein